LRNLAKPQAPVEPEQNRFALFIRQPGQGRADVLHFVSEHGSQIGTLAFRRCGFRGILAVLRVLSLRFVSVAGPVRHARCQKPFQAARQPERAARLDKAYKHVMNGVLRFRLINQRGRGQCNQIVLVPLMNLVHRFRATTVELPDKFFSLSMSGRCPGSI
jgi:hypothetical protein